MIKRDQHKVKRGGKNGRRFLPFITDRDKWDRVHAKTVEPAKPRDRSALPVCDGCGCRRQDLDVNQICSTCRKAAASAQ